MRSVFALTMVFALAGSASAQPAYRLALEKPDFIKNGKLVVMGGVSDPKGHRTFLENLSILQPVDVVLWTLDNNDDIEIALAKDRFDDVISRESTKGRGAAVHRVRTEGDLRFLVTAKGDPKPYRMVIWVGDEVKPTMASVLVSGATTRSRGWIWIAAGIGATGLVALILVVMLKGKKGVSAAAVFIALGLSILHAQPPSGPVHVDSGSVRGGGAGDGGWSSRMESLGGEWERAGNASAPFGFMNTATGTAQNALDWWNEHRNFTPEDTGMMPDYSPDGSPNLPVGCNLNDDAEGCTQCYRQAQGKLNGSRMLLERLRALYEGTKRYVDASVSFGDNTSGIHAVTGLAWQTERRTIMATFEHFERTHEEKRQGMMQGLRAALDEVAACEAQYFNNPDWFNRYGFIYYQFMEARYRR